MAKRFLETTIWDEDWFLMMPTDYKLFFLWIVCKCDHAGFYRPNIELFKRSTGCQIDPKAALEYFNDEKERIMVLGNGRWFIVGFISFQYGSKLNESNRVHNSILQLLALNEVKLGSIRGLIDHKEGVKDKDKDKDKEIEVVQEIILPATTLFTEIGMTHDQLCAKTGIYKAGFWTTVTENLKEVTQEVGEESRVHLDQYIKTLTWINEKATQVNKMDSPLTLIEFIKLKEKISREKILDLLVKMGNYKLLLKKSKSTYLTLNNWHKNELQRQ